MVARKQRTPVVIDTNVFIRNFLARSNRNANRRVIRLWLLEKCLQLIVSQELLAKYLEIFHAVLGMDTETVEQWRRWFEEDSRATVVRLGRRYTASRDPDDNGMLATAQAGRAEYLITNHRDLLDLPVDFQRALACNRSRVEGSKRTAGAQIQGRRSRAMLNFGRTWAGATMAQHKGERVSIALAGEGTSDPSPQITPVCRTGAGCSN